VHPPAAVSACRRRSRASITAMTTSSRCKPPPQYRWQLWSKSCACVPWGHDGACPSLCRGAAGHAQSRLVNSTAADGRTLCRTRGVRACGTARRCVAHRSCQSDLRSTPTIGTARGAGPTSIIGMQPQRPRGAARQVNKRTHSNSRHAGTLPMLEGWDQSRCRCGSGEPSPGAD
jgi:hypothetical protein